MNIRVDLDTTIQDGTEVVFRSPVDCSQVTGLKVYYKKNGTQASQEFAFADAHGNNVGDIDHLFTENVVVKVILDVTTSMAFVQNADTNAYLEGRFSDIENKLAHGIACEASGSVVSVSDSANSKLNGLTIYGKTAQNGIPSPDSPVPLESVGDSGSVGVTVTGKNIFGGDALAEKLITLAGASHNAEKKVVSYNAANISNKVIFSDFKPNTQYTFVLYGKNLDAENPSSNLMVVYEDGSNTGHLTFPVASDYSTLVFTTPKGKTVKELKGVFYTGTSALGYEKCGIFEGVLTEADFEPYSAQTLTVQTPNGLPGIPVASGGNYTDESGQQWICDEIDFDRGMLVQRVGSVDLGTLPVTMYSVAQGKLFRFSFGSIKLYADGFSLPPVLCPNYPTVPQQERRDKTITMPINTAAIDIIDSGYTNAEAFKAAMSGVNILYTRAIPTETPLSAYELSAFAALHTNKPNTTVYTDSNANMKLEYIADTKAYIDNKFAVLAAAIVNNA